MFKRFIKSILFFPLLKSIGRQRLIGYIDNDINLTKHGSTSFHLYTPNDICNYRHKTFSTKEPEMLEWIEEYGGVYFLTSAQI